MQTEKRGREIERKVSLPARRKAMHMLMKDMHQHMYVGSSASTTCSIWL